MDEVRATLQSWNLSQYADVFFEEGYDDLAYLMTLSEEALQRVAEHWHEARRAHLVRSCEGDG